MPQEQAQLSGGCGFFLVFMNHSAIHNRATRLRRFLFKYLPVSPLPHRAELIAAYEDAQAIEAAFFEELQGMPEPAKRLARGTSQEVVDYCRHQGLTIGDAAWFFDKNEGCGWKIAGKAIQNWQAVIRAWKRQSIFPSQKNPQTGRPVDKALTVKLAEQATLTAQRSLRGNGK
jgi:hypothetical protein